MYDVYDEHYSYMALAGREEAYAQAIAAVVRPGDVVADLGCGFGVLGLQCLRAGAARVYGIDKTEAIEIAREAAVRGGFADRYHCLRGSTFEVTLPEPVDVIICDHVGFFGIDYGIAAMLADAARRLLKPDGRIVPGRLVMQLAAIASDACRAQVERWAQEPIPAEFAWLTAAAANSKLTHHARLEELLSAPCSVGDITLEAGTPDAFAFSAQLEITRSGRFDGLVGWFDCELAPGVRMSNSPFAEPRLQRHNAFFPCATPVPVRAGDTVEVRLSADPEAGLFTWTVTGPDGMRQRQSTFNRQVIGKWDLVNADTRTAGLSPIGQAHATVLGMVGAQACTVGDIERVLAADHPELFGSPDRARRFIKSVLELASR